jgi:phosphatidylinositol-3-phosphatase
MGPRSQHALIALVSALATAAVLAGGVGASGWSAEVSTVLRASRERTVALPAAPAPAATEAPESAPRERKAHKRAAAAPKPAPVVAAKPSAPATEDEDPAPESEPAPAKQPAADQPRKTHVGHVFEIVLAGRGFDATFGPGSPAAYLNGSLRPKGVLLSDYRSLGRADLPDHLALIGGQPPNADTRGGCATYTEIPQTAKPTAAGEVRATGCVFPNTVITVADQVAARGLTWRAYVEDLDKTGRPSCRRPASNAADDTLRARPGDGYATRHNPFVYFHSLLDLGGCDASDGPLAPLATDLKKVKTTPAFSYVVPNLCNDGTESPCVDGSPGGLAAADAFLAHWVPLILASPAYRKDGVLLITFAGNVTATADAPSRNGALVVSRFAAAGTTVDAELGPYALLRSVQDALGLKPLARAAEAPSLLDTALAAARIARPGDD